MNGVIAILVLVPPAMLMVALALFIWRSSLRSPAETWKAIRTALAALQPYWNKWRRRWNGDE